jgi:two-component system cell cycle response regulator CtrA
MLLEHLYCGMEEPELKIIDVFVCTLRKKLAQATGGNDYIRTVWVVALAVQQAWEAALGLGARPAT